MPRIFLLAANLGTMYFHGYLHPYKPAKINMLAAIWISIAFTLGLLVKKLGLPPLVGYLIAGFGLSALGFTANDDLNHLAHAGVLLLLFSVGLKLRLKSLFRKEVFAGSLLHMGITVIFTALLFYFTTGLDVPAILLISIGLSFSSTVVAAKVLEAKNELRAFHGRVAIGILIVQDLVAVTLLSVSGAHAPSPWALGLLALPLLRPGIYWLLDQTGHDELLILFGLLLALVVGGVSFEYAGLSPELGALLLGAILAGHDRASELSGALWGLKEVFLVGFFLQIGLTGLPSTEILGYALLICLLLPLKAILLFFLLLLFRLRARSSFLAALSLMTYSEFGLIVASMGMKIGLLDEQWLILLAVTVATSFVIAAPLNRIAHSLYQRWEAYLLPLELKQRHPDDEPIHLGNSHYLIMGMGRIGTGAYNFLSQRQQRVIGLDSDPAKIEKQRIEGRRVLYADAEDPGLWQNIHLEGVHAIMLAMPDIEANTIAARQIRLTGYKGFISATAGFDDELIDIEQAGADIAYNFYDEAGVGFAEHVWEHLHQEQAATER